MNRFLKYTGILFWLCVLICLLFRSSESLKSYLVTIFAIIGLILSILLLFRILFGDRFYIELGKKIFVGTDLIEATELFLTEIPNPSKSTTSNFIGHLVYRFTRLGILGFLIASSTLILLFQQNQKIDQQNNLITKQNIRLDQQTYLQEAERRSSLVFLFSNVMDALDQELKSDYNNNNKRDISPELYGRVKALASRLRPYYYLDSDTLTPKPYSPERGQLLLSLVNSNLDSISHHQIVNINYANSELSETNLIDLDLKGIFLPNSNLSNAFCTSSNLENSDLRYSNLFNTYMKKCTLNNSKMFDANMESIKLDGAECLNVDFKGANIKKGNFGNANLTGSSFYQANLDSAFFCSQPMFIQIKGKLPTKRYHKPGATLIEVNFSNSSLVETNFAKADISKAIFDNAFVDKEFINRLIELREDSAIGTKEFLDTYVIDSLYRKVDNKKYFLKNLKK